MTPPMRDAATAVEVHITPNKRPEERKCRTIINLLEGFLELLLRVFSPFKPNWKGSQEGLSTPGSYHKPQQGHQARDFLPNTCFPLSGRIAGIQPSEVFSPGFKKETVMLNQHEDVEKSLVYRLIQTKLVRTKVHLTFTYNQLKKLLTSLGYM